VRRGRNLAQMVAPARQQRMVIRAARVGGVEIPNQKRVECALTYIFGIGPVTAKAILTETVRSLRCCACCRGPLCLHAGGSGAGG